MKLVIFFALLLLVKFENKNKIKTNFFDLNTGTSSRESDEAKSNIVGFLYVFVIFVFNFKSKTKTATGIYRKKCEGH